VPTAGELRYRWMETGCWTSTATRTGSATQVAPIGARIGKVGDRHSYFAQPRFLLIYGEFVAYDKLVGVLQL
jgi:hypothetical protein